MAHETITFTNCFGEALGPFLTALRATGFFEAEIFMTMMTAASVLLFAYLVRTAGKSPTGGMNHRFIARPLWMAACFALCFLATNVTAVALKTLIVEELDYERSVWFAPLVGPLHFYILSVVVAYLVLIFRARRAAFVRVLCAYVQVGLLGGYMAGAYRFFHEPITLGDPTSGISGLVFVAWFGLYNWDIAARYRSTWYGNRSLDERRREQIAASYADVRTTDRCP